MLFHSPSSRCNRSFSPPINMDSNLKAVSSHEEMHKAFVLAGSKVEKTIKDETPSERFHRICDAKEAKQNKKAKSSARTQVRKKVIKKMTVCFPKKNKPQINRELFSCRMKFSFPLLPSISPFSVFSMIN